MVARLLDRSPTCDVVRPPTWAEALAARSERPGLLPIAGGTDVMVDLNLGRSRPEGLLDLTRLEELAGWRLEHDTVILGAGVTWAQVATELADLAPGLALAARTVGSPPIRNRGTVAGNLASGSPAGDAFPPLLAVGAEVAVESVRGRRTVPVDRFCTGAKRTVLAPDELIREVRLPVPDGPQRFAKVGHRQAMVIAVASFAIALHASERRVGTGLGSVAATPRSAPAAERFAAGMLDWAGGSPLEVADARRFGALVGEAADPIDDARGSAAYRRHALAVLATRTLGWAWEEHRSTGAGRRG